MNVMRVDPSEWKEHFSEQAHNAGFRKFKDPHLERIDYALLSITDNNEVCAYVTCKELDGENVYWQFGASLGEYRHTHTSYRSIGAFIKYAKEHQYKRIAMLIENTNIKMLKMALKTGFLVTGIRFFEGKILVEHTLKFGGTNA